MFKKNKFVIFLLLAVMLPAIAGTVLDSLRVDNVNVDGNTISILDTDGDLSLTPNGTGAVNLGGSKHALIPSGTTAQRDGSPAVGMFRHNTSLSQYELYTSSWEKINLGPITPGFTTVTKTTTATLATTNEDNVLVDSSGGDFTVTLPAASGNSGLTYKITHSVDGGLVTIDGNASETIGGELTVVLASKDDSIIITTDGTAWFYLSDDVSYFARYMTNAGLSVNTSTDTTILYEDIETDPRGSYNTGTGVYTFPIAGVFEACARALLSGRAAAGSNTRAFIYATFTGTYTDQIVLGLQSGGNATAYDLYDTHGCVTRKVDKDDTVLIGINHTTGSSDTLSASQVNNYMQIKRIK